MRALISKSPVSNHEALWHDEWCVVCDSRIDDKRESFLSLSTQCIAPSCKTTYRKECIRRT